MRRGWWLGCMVAGLLVLVAVGVSQAQQRGRGGFGFGGFGGGFGGGGGLLGLLRMEAVQKELELVDEQLTKINQLAEAQRGQRGQGGERPDFQNMSDEERAQFFARMREEAAKREAEVRTKLAEILLPHQMERLEQLNIQRQGVAALSNPDVQAKLKLTDAQKSKLEAVQRDFQARLREQFQPGGGGDFAQIRERMESLRKEMEEQAVGVLTAEQKQQFEAMKGKPFEFPQPQFGPGGRGQRGGRGGQGAPGGARPQRPGT